MTTPKYKEEPTEFRVGDICEAFGLECVVDAIREKTILYPASIEVRFKDKKLIISFGLDGKASHWHKTPSLKLIRRADPKVEEKKVVWRYRYSCLLQNGTFFTPGGYYKNKKEFLKTYKDVKEPKRLARSKKIRGGG